MEAPFRSGRHAGRTVLAVCLTCMLMAYALLGFFYYPLEDDLRYEGVARRLGFQQAQIHWYRMWSGRFTTNAVLTLLTQIGSLTSVVRWVPGCVLLLFFLSLWSLLHRWTEARPPGVASWLCALGLLALYLRSQPALLEGLYFFSGAICYQLGPILAFSAGALMLGLGGSRSSTTWSRVLVASLLTALAAGTNELLLGPLGIAILAGLWQARRHRESTWPAWLIPGLALLGAALVMLLAPGNARRAATPVLTGNRDLLLALHLASLHTVGHTLGWLLEPGLLAASLLWAGWHGRSHSSPGEPPPDRRDARRSLVLMVVVWLMAQWTAYFPAFFGLGRAVPDRVRNTVFLVFLLGWFGIVRRAALDLPTQGPLASRPLLRAARWFLILALLLGGNLPRVLEDLTRAPAYHRAMVEREQAAHAAARMSLPELRVAPLRDPPIYLVSRDLLADPEAPRNRVFAEYWGVPKVRLRPGS